MIQINLSKGLMVLLTVALSGTVFERPMSAARTVPFRASFTTEFTSSVAFPFVYVTVNGEGQALHLGRTQAATTNQTVNLITGAGTATYTLTAANGDTLVIDMTVHTDFPSPTLATFAGSFTIVGGTGRFADASGSGSIDGSASFTGPTNGIGEFSLDGVIS